MRVLLDTHTFLWAVLEPGKLSRRVRSLLQDPQTQIVLSAVCAWEISTKYRLGKLPDAAAVVERYGEAVSGLQAEELPVSRLHALQAGLWAFEHRDPFDRMLAAQAALEHLPLLTNDPALAQFSVPCLW
jgi:PIN domain nuclease of toxin-antitoxin system